MVQAQIFTKDTAWGKQDIIQGIYRAWRMIIVAGSKRKEEKRKMGKILFENSV